jgi:hypothetical protein
VIQVILPTEFAIVARELLARCDVSRGDEIWSKIPDIIGELYEIGLIRVVGKQVKITTQKVHIFLLSKKPLIRIRFRAIEGKASNCSWVNIRSNEGSKRQTTVPFLIATLVNTPRPSIVLLAMYVSSTNIQLTYPPFNL